MGGEGGRGPGANYACRIHMELNTSSVTLTIPLGIQNVFRMGHTTCLFSKLSFSVLIVRSFFLFSHFLVAKVYELSQSRSHFLSVPLTLEDVRILSWSISFSSTSTLSLSM